MDEIRLRARRAFTALVERADAAIPLAEAALLIAAEEYPDLDTSAYLAHIDALGQGGRAALSGEHDPRVISRTLVDYLYEVQGFRGNATEYYDPRNSFLNEVLDRRLGIPITLSILFLEVAQRVGLEARGVGLPGHFVVQVTATGTYVDLFHGRADLDDADCAARVRELYGNDTAFEPAMLALPSRREILGRVLRNLLEIYRAAGDHPRALAALDRMVVLAPSSPRLRRERAALLAQVGEYRRALADLRELRDLQPARRRSERSRAWRRFVEAMAGRMN